MKKQLNEIQKLQKIAGIKINEMFDNSHEISEDEISESKINIGDDGYGGKNITISQKDGGIEIIKRDANDMNRVSGNIYIPIDPESIDELIAFLTKVKSNPGKKKKEKEMSDDEMDALVKQRLKQDLGRDF
tara:strand:- start:3395 stop:3787 length:393 start_codon:yes stop_codon:yes gene_type:complete